MLFMAGSSVPERIVLIISLPVSMRWEFLLPVNLLLEFFQPESFLLEFFQSESLMLGCMLLVFLYWHGRKDILNGF